MTPIRLLALSLLLVLSACREQPEPTRSPPEPRGREETRSIRNTEAIGYSGEAVADKVDTALDANDQRKEQLDKALETQEQP